MHLSYSITTNSLYLLSRRLKLKQISASYFQRQLQSSTTWIKSKLNQTHHLQQKIAYPYHISYIMDSKHDDRFTKIDRNAFHLYKQSLLNFQSESKFNQKAFLLIIIDCVRTRQPENDFIELFQYGLRHLHQITELISVINLGSQLYLHNYQDKQKAYLIAKRCFDFFKSPQYKSRQITVSSYYIMKMFVFIQKNVGLQKFNDQDYSCIKFETFKPLFLCFILQMFYTNKLQYYKTCDYIFKLFTSNVKIIPIIDLHHYRIATRVIQDQGGLFKKFVDKVGLQLAKQKNLPQEEKVLNETKGKQQDQSTSINQSNLSDDKMKENVFGNRRKSQSQVKRVNEHRSISQDDRHQLSSVDRISLKNKFNSIFQNAYSRSLKCCYSYYQKPKMIPKKEQNQ